MCTPSPAPHSLSTPRDSKFCFTPSPPTVTTSFSPYPIPHRTFLTRRYSYPSCSNAFLSGHPHSISRLTSRGRRCHTPASSRTSPPTSSVQTPDSFSTHWYQDTVTPLDIDLSSNHIPNPDSTTTPYVDHSFVDQEARVMALVDYGAPSPNGQALLDDIRHTLLKNTQLYGNEARIDLRRGLSTALLRWGAPSGFSALAMQFTSNLVRVAWAGFCGFVLIRDDRIFYRSYDHTPPRDALENVLEKPQEEKHDGARRYWLKWGGSASLSATGGYIDGAFTDLAAQGQDLTVDCEQINADFIELEDNDLIIVGSDGFFANVSEEQILAFVRPVPDPEDKTLALAGNLCLASWRQDDVDFIAYYLAIIALNFATATNSKPNLPFPFPPSPHADDITVMCAACSSIS